LNTSDQSTFARSNTTNTSVIDLTFATPNLALKIMDWYISERFQTGSDHELIGFSICTENTETVINPIIQGLYNLEKADWEKFKQIIREKSIDLSDLMYQNSENIECTNSECASSECIRNLELFA
jgi:hypothetical protein